MPIIMQTAYYVHGALKQVLPCEILDRDQKLFIKRCIAKVESVDGEKKIT
jgi:hypothetical protein